MWKSAYNYNVFGGFMMRSLVRAIKALSDETRLRILRVLMERECCVCEIMQALDISQSRSSRNLGILENAGFVKSKRDGLWTVHFIDLQDAEKYYATLVRTVKDALNGSEQVALDLERLKKAVRVGPVKVNQEKKVLKA
jgi:ArsR family transcriptional regulator